MQHLIAAGNVQIHKESTMRYQHNLISLVRCSIACHRTAPGFQMVWKGDLVVCQQCLVLVIGKIRLLHGIPNIDLQQQPACCSLSKPGFLVVFLTLTCNNHLRQLVNIQLGIPVLPSHAMCSDFLANLEKQSMHLIKLWKKVMNGEMKLQPSLPKMSSIWQQLECFPDHTCYMHSVSGHLHLHSMLRIGNRMRVCQSRKLGLGLGTRVKRRECTTAKECKWQTGAWQSWWALVSFHVQ